MNTPTENDDYDPSNNPPANISPLHQNQEAGFCITQNANEMSFNNPVDHIRDMHEEDRARAQNIPMVNLMQPPIYPLMTSNIHGGTFQSHAHPFMVNIDDVSSGGTQSNNPQRPQIDRSFLTFRGNTTDEFRPSSQWHGMGTGTNFRPDSVTFSGLYGPQIDRNIPYVGANMNAAYQIHDQQELMVRNQVRNAVPSNNRIFPEQTLNLGFGDDTVNTFPSNAFVGIPSNNGMAVTPHSFLRPQVDGSSLRLGGNFGDLNWPNGNSGNTVGTNAGSNPILFGTLQRPQGDVQHCYPIQGGRIVGIRSNRGARNLNLDPHRGSQGYSGAASGHLSDIQAQVLANQQARQAIVEQARWARVAQLSSTPTQIPNEFVRAQLQQAHLNNTRSIHANSSMVSPFVGTAGSATGRDQSGHTGRSFDASVAHEASKHFTNIADMREHAQQAIRGTPVPCKGKRSPAEGSQYAQSAKVLLGTSVSSGKPVPVPVGSVIKPVPIRPQHVAKSRLMPPTSASAIPSFPRHKRTPQNFNRPASSPEYIKRKDSTESSQTIDENCALCKRNLTFAPDPAPVSQPSIPPEVAVLPCGHTFHDECLQRITPPDQSKDPPCIPCALGKF
ncbi:zinc finger protein [Macleaya cordata]|uniref:Zinc finger protein n=1 Tax=Macleaya cordata TaxID=56857 RepID=A0A200QHA7_MACCD|nr:zinc finger protein [Macleaya cordata]